MPKRKESLEGLLARDSLQARTQLYLRLLYSDAAERELNRAVIEVLPAPTQALLKSLDRGRISREREARIRNLAGFIRRGSPALAKFLGEELFLKCIDAFANSFYFWEGKGRTLVEAFCLFCFDKKIINRQEGRDLAQLTGVASGLLANVNRSSPWSDHVLRISRDAKGALAEESFECRGDLLSYVNSEFDDRCAYRGTGILHVIRVTKAGKSSVSVTCMSLRA